MKIKNIRKILVVVIVAFFTGLSVTSSIHATTIKNVKSCSLNKTSTEPQATSFDGYLLHDPIYISGNDNFTTENGVTGGSGTKDDPYIIEGWEIDASKARSRSPPNSPAGIYIESHTVKDCWVGGTSQNCERGDYTLISNILGQPICEIGGFVPATCNP